MSKSITEVEVDKIICEENPPPGFKVKDVKCSETHFENIKFDFEKAGIEVLKIEKVENLQNTFSYENKKKQLLKNKGERDPDYKLNERYLYHGTAGSRHDLLEQGFDDKLTKQGCFGKGLYFSDNVKKCLKYANRREGDESIIFCVRLLLGDAKVFKDGEVDRSILREPEASHGKFRFHCSVKGRPREYNEYVVYRGSQTLIEYVITYRKPENDTSENDIPDPIPEPVDPPSLESSPSPSSSREASPSRPEPFTDSSDDEIETLKEQVKKLDIDSSKMRDMFIEKTGEKTDYIIDSFLIVTDYQLDLAVDLYLNREKIDQEIERLRKEILADLDEDDENDATATFHPEGVPHYDSDEWKSLSKEEKEKHIENFVKIFMTVVALEDEHKSFAQERLEKEKYDIDKTIISFYGIIW